MGLGYLVGFGSAVFRQARGVLRYIVIVMSEGIEQAKSVRLITPEYVRRILDEMAENLTALPKPEIKAFVASIVARVILDPGESRYCIEYKIPLGTGDLVASPRGFEPLLPP